MLVTLLTAVVSFMNPYLRKGGTELVADVSASEVRGADEKMFAECQPGSKNPLCEPHIKDMMHQVWILGSALLIKVGLTIITFGLKLPGESASLSDQSQY